MADVAFWLRSAEFERNTAILEDFATCFYCQLQTPHGSVFRTALGGLGYVRTESMCCVCNHLRGNLDRRLRTAACRRAEWACCEVRHQLQCHALRTRLSYAQSCQDSG